MESSLRERINSICDPLLLLYSRNEFSFLWDSSSSSARGWLRPPLSCWDARTSPRAPGQRASFSIYFFLFFCYSNNNNIICCCYIDSISSFILSADCCNSSSSSSRVYRGVAILLLAGRGHRNGEWHGEPTPLGPVWIVLDLRDIHTTKVDGLLYTVETDDSVECPLYKCTAGHNSSPAEYC